MHMFLWSTSYLYPASIYILYYCWIGQLAGTYKDHSESNPSYSAICMSSKGTGEETLTSCYAQPLNCDLSPQTELRHHSWKPCSSWGERLPGRVCTGRNLKQLITLDNYQWTELRRKEPKSWHQPSMLYLKSDEPEGCWVSAGPQSWKHRELEEKIHGSLVSSRDFPIGFHCLSREREN